MLNAKINEHFTGMVVRKDLVKKIKGNAVVPTYVLEYLLGQYCASDNEDNIQSGIETVKDILSKHYVHRNEAGKIKSVIREQRRHKIIDKISVELNDKRDVYEAKFSNLGISKVLVDSETIKTHEKLLTDGVWCIAGLEYLFSEDQKASPWLLESLKPIQLSSFDYDFYLSQREKFTTEEWIDLLIQSIGFEPSKLSKRNKLFALTRLVPFCERNYNLIELGSKGTGKSHIYSEFSPHGILISGGEVTVPKLFVNNSTGKIGLVGFWDVVAFDEFAGKKKKVDNALVDILKNYMANKTFSRGIEPLGAEASMVFMGNNKHTLPYMLKHGDLFEDLPDKYYDSAILDRLHFYIPGWEVDIIRSELFTSGYGFVVDYLAEILRHMRNADFSNQYEEHFELSDSLSTRDKVSVRKTFSGLMKIIFPHQKSTKEEIQELLVFAMEGRKRIKQNLLKMDKTFTEVTFEYYDGDKTTLVKTLEEKIYPKYFTGSSLATKEPSLSELDFAPEPVETPKPELKENHLVVEENQTGISYERLFAEYVADANKIVITDPYIRNFYQTRNLMEFIEVVAKHKPEDEEVEIHLITGEDEFKPYQQDEFFNQIKDSVNNVGIYFTWEYDKSNTIHARHIVTDSGWKISLDRGLDVFQQFDMNDAFAIENRGQQFRKCKGFEVTYLRV